MTKVIKSSDYLLAVAEERRLKRRAARTVRDFVEAVCTGNAELLKRCWDEFEALEANEQCRAAMEAVAKSPGAPDDFREGLLGLWVHGGDKLRNWVRDDLVLADGLRAMLPPYTGPAITLYRGEGALNHQQQAYGLSWSASAEVGRDFASRPDHRLAEGGSVLLETLAPPEAIICAAVMYNDGYGEKEYLVDRRRLRTVKVVDEFSLARRAP